MPDYDYIIIGAGSAGCVLADRLTENPSARVLLLEAGPVDGSMWIDIPVGFAYTPTARRHTQGATLFVLLQPSKIRLRLIALPTAVLSVTLEGHSTLNPMPPLLWAVLPITVLP